MTYTPAVAPRPGMAKKLLVAVLGIVVLVAAMMFTTRQSSAQEVAAQECGADAYFSITVPGEGISSALPEGFATGPDGLIAKQAGSEIVFNYPSGPPQGVCGSSDNALLNPWAARVVGWAAGLAVAACVAAGMVAIPPPNDILVAPYILSTTNLVLTTIKTYLEVGLGEGKWGWQAIAATLLEDLITIIGGATLRAIWPEIDQAFVDGVKDAAQYVSSGWFGNLLRPAAESAIGEIELVSTEIGRLLASQPATNGTAGN